VNERNGIANKENHNTPERQTSAKPILVAPLPLSGAVGGSSIVNLEFELGIALTHCDRTNKSLRDAVFVQRALSTPDYWPMIPERCSRHNKLGTVDRQTAPLCRVGLTSGELANARYTSILPVSVECRTVGDNASLSIGEVRKGRCPQAGA
jgi:hypothetical protein